MSVPEFTAVLGSVLEHSSWVAARAAGLRPFASVERLHQALCRQWAQASEAEQDAVLQAQPRLGARGRQRAQLTQSSAREQQRAGLDACTDAQCSELLRLNDLYQARFGFPFILAVRGHSAESILAALNQRLRRDRETERATAMRQLYRIAGLRLNERIAAAPDSAAQATQ